MTVKNGTTTLCSETLPTGSGDSASFSCALTATQLAVGTYSSVDAVFSPAATSSSSSTVSYTTSTSTPVKSLTVNRATKSTTTTLHPVTSPITVGAETAETFSGTVTGQSGDGYPEGTVTVENGTTTLCSQTLPSGSGDSTTYSCSLTASQLGAGTYSSVEAVFTPGTSSSSNADFGYTGSASTPLQSLTVKPSTTSSNNLQIQLSSSGLVSGVGGIYLLTVTNHASTASTGTLTITDALPAGLSYNGVLADPPGVALHVVQRHRDVHFECVHPRAWCRLPVHGRQRERPGGHQYHEQGGVDSGRDAGQQLLGDGDDQCGAEVGQVPPSGWAHDVAGGRRRVR